MTFGGDSPWVWFSLIRDPIRTEVGGGVAHARSLGPLGLWKTS